MDAAHILADPRIRAAVLGHLSPGPYPDGQDLTLDSPEAKQRHESHRALGRLAVVCRSLSGAALDALWQHVDDVSSLLRALAAFDPTRRMFTSTFTEAEWIRFRTYTSRVRELRLGDAASLHPSVWVILTRWCLREPFLPRLERLVGLNVDASSMAYTMLFASETLRSISLHVPRDTEKQVVSMAIQTIAPYFDSLSSLVVNDQASKRTDAVQFWTLPQLKTLRVLHKVTLDVQQLQALAAFPHLRVLDIALNKKIPHIDKQETHSGFLSLRELALSGPLDAIRDFVLWTAGAPLESMAIDVTYLCEEDRATYGYSYGYRSSVNPTRSLEPIYAALTPSLRHFRAIFRCHCTAEVRHFPDSRELFSGLHRAAPALQTVSFVFQDMVFLLGDDALSALTDAWPDLTELEIATRKDRPPPPAPVSSPRIDYMAEELARCRRGPRIPIEAYPIRAPKTPPPHVPPTIETVALFARAHPRLTRLVLPLFDLSARPDVVSVSRDIGHGLRELGIGALKRGVPLFRHALFPRLDLTGAEDLIPGDAGSTAGADGGSGPSTDEEKLCDRSAELRLVLRALQEGRASALRSLHAV
ncbi:hypothetical protein C8Q77DRAFT_1141688 [Trametes polyzona]|nr:hypothetical protein C8Q77DRAFT_1141688 [Trametes polyzona]